MRYLTPGCTPDGKNEQANYQWLISYLTQNDTLRSSQARVSLGTAASRTALLETETDGNAGAALRGYYRTQVILVAAQLCLADQLAGGLRSAVDRARRTESHPGALADRGDLAFAKERDRLTLVLRRGLAAFGPRQQPL